MPASPSGTTKSERTQQAILDAAEELFSAHGFDGASLDAIGDKAGIQGTAILYHFPSKRALYEATLDRIFKPLFEELNALLDAPDPVDRRLEAAVAAMVRYAAEHPNAPLLVLREMTSGDSDAREIIDARAATSAARVVAAFASQSEQRDVDPMMVANIILGAVCFYFVGPPGIDGGQAYDPRSPALVEAFGVTMRNLTRSLLRMNVGTAAD